MLFAKDIKNAYFSGKNITREVYLDPPRGGLRGLQQGQLLRARKAIYGFAEAARLFWLALKEQLEADGWQESKLEPALFYLRHQGQLKGILVTHVDDLEGGVSPDLQQSAFEKASQALESSQPTTLAASSSEAERFDRPQKVTSMSPCATTP